jgi:hypothetical protein
VVTHHGAATDGAVVADTPRMRCSSTEQSSAARLWAPFSRGQANGAFCPAAATDFLPMAPRTRATGGASQRLCHHGTLPYHVKRRGISPTIYVAARPCRRTSLTDAASERGARVLSR